MDSGKSVGELFNTGGDYFHSGHAVSGDTVGYRCLKEHYGAVLVIS